MDNKTINVYPVAYYGCRCPFCDQSIDSDDRFACEELMTEHILSEHKDVDINTINFNLTGISIY